VLSDEAVPT